MPGETQEATDGYNGEFWLGNPITLYELNQVVAFDIPDEGEREQEEKTHLKSPGRRREYFSTWFADSDFEIVLNSRPLSDTDPLMANALKGERVVTLKDGRRLTIVFDFDALIEAEGLYGKPLPVMLADAQANFFGAVRALMWGALRTRHPEMTPRDVSDMLAENTPTLMEALGDAHSAAMPEDEKSAGGKAEGATKPRRGKRSGGNGAKQA